MIDTSTLPDNIEITNVSYYYPDQFSSNYGLGNGNFSLTKFNIDGTFSADDFNNVDNTLLAADVNHTEDTPTWYFNSLGFSNISKDGVTGIAVRYDWDVTNTAPTWASGATSYHYHGDANPRLTITYTPPPVAAFAANVTGSKISPTDIGFTDTSTGTPTNWDWYWYANETKSSDDQNPSTSLTFGVYDVRLYVSSALGGDWENKTAYITIDENIATVLQIYPTVDSSITYNNNNQAWSTLRAGAGTSLSKSG